MATETATKEQSTTRCTGLPVSLQDDWMYGSGQSRKDAAGRMLGVPNAKSKIKIGFWNVCTIFDAGKLAHVTREMRRYDLDILGISETRWTSSGKFHCISGETIIYSGRKDNQ